MKAIVCDAFTKAITQGDAMKNGPRPRRKNGQGQERNATVPLGAAPSWGTDSAMPSRRQRREQQRNTPSLVMDVGETAAFMRLSEQMIYDEANQGNLPVVRRGKRILIIKPLLEEMLLKEAQRSWNSSEHDSPACPRCGWK